MGIIARFADIIKANVNDLIDKCEDPAKMIDQCLRDLADDLAQVKKETAAIMAEETRAQRNVDKYTALVKQYTAAAEKALMAGNEADATTLLTSKQENEALLTTATAQLNMAKQNAAKMRQMYNKLVKDMESLNARRENIKAQASMAKAQERINNMSAVASAQATTDKFARMEAKAQKMLDAANAEAQLNADITTGSDLLAQYSAGAAPAVNDELEAMKARLGLSKPAAETAIPTTPVEVTDDDDDDDTDPVLAAYLEGDGNNQ